MELKTFKSAKKFKEYLSQVQELPTDVNRKVFDTNMKAIKDSILEIGILRVIVVVETKLFSENKSKDKYIIDAQHLRRVILKMDDEKLFGLFGVVVINMDKYSDIVKHISLLNSVGKPRTLSQYLSSWVYDQKTSYVTFNELLKENKYTINALIECLTQQKSTGNVDFKDGSFNPTTEQMVKGLQLIKLHQKLMGTGLKYAQNSFSALVRFCIDNPHITHDVIYRNVKKQSKIFKEIKSRDVFISNLKAVCCK